jgi:hypothetical protein
VALAVVLLITVVVIANIRESQRGDAAAPRPEVLVLAQTY